MKIITVMAAVALFCASMDSWTAFWFIAGVYGVAMAWQYDHE